MEDDEEYLEVIIPGGSELPRARELSRETDFSLKPRTYELKDCYLDCVPVFVVEAVHQQCGKVFKSCSNFTTF